MLITILSFPYAILFFSVINKFPFVLNNFSGIKERIILIKNPRGREIMVEVLDVFKI
jgi:hypothetical protein